ncbi:MAG: hypothetical protein Q7T61_16120 [Caulobacter sp.]|nr:hypothetical protein [Caulobacter sp.]
MKKLALVAAIAATLTLGVGVAVAQTFPIKMASYDKNYFKGSNAVILPTYNLTFITANQATAVGGGARARNTKVLAGVDEATMRRLADEAHADLRAQFVAAGLPVASDETAQAMVVANTIPLQPGNRHVVDAKGGITVNKSLRQSYVSVGAAKAPILAPYKTDLSGGSYLSMIQFNNRIAKGQPEGSLVVIPTLVIDFANMSAAAQSGFKRNTASAGGAAVFSIRGVASGTFFAKVIDRGRIFPFYIRPEGDYGVPNAFARDEAGAADVAPLSVMGESVARGDAVVVDLPAWENLVRAAFRAHNATIVAATLRGK